METVIENVLCLFLTVCNCMLNVVTVAVFKYDSTSHNVVAVDKSGYSNCRSTAGARVFRSGNDQIKLGKGQNYFICNYPGHCESGMKISINAV